MGVAVIACQKDEECYIREWVEWHFHLGVEHIYIVDNNSADKNDLLCDVLRDYVDQARVTIKNYRGVHPIQPFCYDEVYQEVKFLHDWFYICDIDEFLHIPKYDDDINLLMENYQYCDSLFINWVDYDDNGLIYQDDRPVQERFTHKASSPYSDKGKSIIKGRMRYTIDHQHDPFQELCARCNVLHKFRHKNSKDVGDYEEKEKIAHIRHYRFKTIEEYIMHKVLRGDTYKDINDPTYPYKPHNFWCLNEKTPEKEAAYRELIEKHMKANEK